MILYNLGIGAKESELQWVYENHDDFQALPTFGVIPQFAASAGISMDFLPNFNPVSALLEVECHQLNHVLVLFHRLNCCMESNIFLLKGRYRRVGR